MLSRRKLFFHTDPSVLLGMVNSFPQFSTIDVFLCFTDPRKGKLRFSWKGDGKPEQVDWEGQRNQFDCAKEQGLQQVVPWKHSLSIVWLPSRSICKAAEWSVDCKDYQGVQVAGTNKSV